MRAREALSLVIKDGVTVELVPDFSWPDDWYEVRVWKRDGKYFMQLHNEDEYISDEDGTLILPNMTSYNGDWRVSESAADWNWDDGPTDPDERNRAMDLG
jgi:hypothetical protein